MSKTATKTKPKKAHTVILAPGDHPARAWLGRELLDVASGMTGMCSSYAVQSNGNVMVGIQPAGDGKERPKSWVFDAAGVDVIGDGLAERVGPIEPCPFEIGDVVLHTVSPFTGVVVTQHWFANGCCHVVVAAAKLDDNGLPVHGSLAAGEFQKVGVNKSIAAIAHDAAASPARPPGGPAFEEVRGR